MIQLLILSSKVFRPNFLKPRKYNSVIRLRHDVRRERIMKLADQGYNQAEIVREMNHPHYCISYSTVKREIKAINEELDKWL